MNDVDEARKAVQSLRLNYLNAMKRSYNKFNVITLNYEERIRQLENKQLFLYGLIGLTSIGAFFLGTRHCNRRRFR